MSNPKYIQHPAIILSGTAILLTIVTLAVHDWNRISHHTVSSSTTEEQRIALLFFSITLLVIYGLPIILTLLTGKTNDDRRWPIYEVSVLIIGIFLGTLVFRSDLDISTNYKELLEVFLPYIAAIFAYSFATKKGVANLRAKYWGKALTNIGVVLAAGTIIFVLSWIMVYFE